MTTTEMPWRYAKTLDFDPASSETSSKAPTRYMLDQPRLEGQGADTVISATIRPADPGTIWTQHALEGLPQASGAAHYATGSIASRTEVLDDELLGLIYVDNALHIYPRPVRNIDVENPWAYELPLWQRLLEAFDVVRTRVRTEDGEVARLASECASLSGLNDGQLAALFPGQVHRETFNRWKMGRSDNPTPGNLRRLGLLQRFFANLAGRIDNPRIWLLSPNALTTETPYELLRQGRFDDAEDLLWSLDDSGADVGRTLPPSRAALEIGDDSPPDDDDDGEYFEAQMEEDNDR